LSACPIPANLPDQPAHRQKHQTGDRPGVTKGKQWLTVKAEGVMGTFQLLDTRGFCGPSLKDPNVGMNLAFCVVPSKMKSWISPACFGTNRSIGQPLPAQLKNVTNWMRT
jgi:hypothetical protein